MKGYFQVRKLIEYHVREGTMRIVKIVCISFLLPLSGCGFLYDNTIGLFYDSPPPPQERTHRVGRGREIGEPTEQSFRSQPVPPPPPRGVDIVITWQVPSAEIDAFLLRYGFSKESLTNQIRVAVGELEKKTDPQYGPVYKYSLKGIPADKDLFVSIASVRGTQTSPESEPWQVAATKQ